MLYNFTTLAHVVSVPTLNFVTLEMVRGRAAITRCGVRRHNFVTLGGAVRAAANFATLETSVHGAASEEEK